MLVHAASDGRCEWNRAVDQGPPLFFSWPLPPNCPVRIATLVAGMGRSVIE
jgi:hypothetical protein